MDDDQLLRITANHTDEEIRDSHAALRVSHARLLELVEEQRKLIDSLRAERTASYDRSRTINLIRSVMEKDGGLELTANQTQALWDAAREDGIEIMNLRRERDEARDVAKYLWEHGLDDYWAVIPDGGLAAKKKHPWLEETT